MLTLRAVYNTVWSRANFYYANLVRFLNTPRGAKVGYWALYSIPMWILLIVWYILETKTLYSPSLEFRSHFARPSPFRASHSARLPDHLNYSICFSSIPKRFHYLPDVVASFRNLEIPPQEIHLNIPRFFSRFNYTTDVSAFDYLGIVVNIVDDIGPMNKIMCSAKGWLLVVDDDKLLPTDFFNDFARVLSRNMPGLALGKSGFNIERNLYIDGINEDWAQRVHVLEAINGYVIHSDWVDIPWVRGHSFFPQTRWEDDVWVSAMLEHSGVVKLIIPTRSVVKTPIYFELSGLINLSLHGSVNQDKTIFKYLCATLWRNVSYTAGTAKAPIMVQ